MNLLAEYLEKPLTAVPDPFEKYDSFAHHNNTRLQAYLDVCFDYEFVSATAHYQSGAFDATVESGNYQAVQDIILPSLGEERRQTYSPFLPICPTSGKVLMVAIEPVDVAAGLIRYKHPDSGVDMKRAYGRGVQAAMESRLGSAGGPGSIMKWPVRICRNPVKLSSRITKALGHTLPGASMSFSR